jgi:hypothetical protein
LKRTRAIRSNFDEWIGRGRADSIAVRELLKDYVITLLDTGARPGKELLCLTWVQVKQALYPTVKKTGVMEDDGEGNIEEIATVNANRTVFLNIQESKTKSRIAVGRLPTVRALKSTSTTSVPSKVKVIRQLPLTDTAQWPFKSSDNGCSTQPGTFISGYL